MTNDLFSGDHEVSGSAVFSEDGRFRFVLSRWWRPGPRALIIGANPSKAGWPENDPTVHRIIALTRERWAGFDLVNECPFISTDPEGVRAWRAGVELAEADATWRRNRSTVRQLAAKPLQ